MANGRRFAYGASMDDGLDTPPQLRGDLSGTPEQAARIEASPLPRAVEVFVPQGTYGMGPHVPLTPYIPPLPPALREAEERPGLRVVGEDPLAFLAKQAHLHRAAAIPEPAPEAPLRRFRTPSVDGDLATPPELAGPPRPRDPGHGSVAPPPPRS